MTKKQLILDSSLELFTEKGVKSTTTKSIAIHASVSEALIFKYFGTKDNLLDEILRSEYQQASKKTLEYLQEPDALKYILKIVELPVILVNSHRAFWKMQYNILSLNQLSKKYHRAFITPCEDHLKHAFSELNYTDPELEAELLLMLIDALWKHYASGRKDEQMTRELIGLIQRKYMNN